MLLRRPVPTALGVVALASLVVLLLDNDVFCSQRGQLVDRLIHHGRAHCVPCEDLSSFLNAMRAISEHQDTERQIEEVNPGFVDVFVNSWSCPGKGDIHINYATGRDRTEIERIIGAETFFGIPYNLFNT